MFSSETRALMEAAVDAIIVIDHRGCITAVNDATCRMFGYRTDEMLGNNVSMLMPEPDRSAHDGYLSRYLTTNHGRIIGIGREVTAQRQGGRTFPAQLSVGRIQNSPRPRFVGLLRDVSQDHENLAALKLERDRANAFLELHDSILLVLDARGRIREVNARGAELLGGPVADILGREFKDFARGDAERERAMLLLSGALGSGHTREREMDALDMTGRHRRIYWRCIPLRAADGESAGWLCSGADVTENARREQEAHRAQERLTRVARLATMGEMAAGVAHELNQPLTAITTYARACERFLQMEHPDFAEIKDAVHEIAAEGLRAGEIIRRLRKMVRVDPPDEPAALDLSGLIEELRSLMLADARAHDARLRIALTDNLPRIRANAVPLQQVVLNLVRNALEALDAMPAGSREVEVSTVRTHEGDVEIRVADNGPGIAPAIADRLFEPFVTTKESGTGLGLAISHTIVQSHGGSIGTRPVDPHGVCFFVRLPVAEEVWT